MMYILFSISVPPAINDTRTIELTHTYEHIEAPLIDDTHIYEDTRVVVRSRNNNRTLEYTNMYEDTSGGIATVMDDTRTSELTNIYEDM